MGRAGGLWLPPPSRALQVVVRQVEEVTVVAVVMVWAAAAAAVRLRRMCREVVRALRVRASRRGDHHG